MQNAGVVFCQSAAATGNFGGLNGVPYSPFAGGKAAAVVTGTVSGSAFVQLLGMDSSTWLTVATFNGANGVQTFDAPMGQYRLVLSGGTPAGVWGSLVRIPY